MSAALAIENLSVAYRARGEEREVLRGVSFAVPAGGAYGLVGESGSGKSTLALAALRLLPGAGRLTGGRVRIDGREPYVLDAGGLRRLRAHDVSMVFQNPARALNPSLTIGRQVAEAYEVLGWRRAEAEERAVAMLERVRIAAAARVMASYPRQLSGGMQQRVLLAMALAKDPLLLVLDEPTTGLDATVEAELIDLIAALRGELGTAHVLISHNLGVVARLCRRVGVLYAGRLVEEGPAAALLADPRHPYTLGLLQSLPSPGRRKDQGRLATIPGFPPPPGRPTEGCVFAARCVLADQRCRTEPPAAVDLGGRVSLCHYVERIPPLAHGTIRGVAFAPVGRAPTPAVIEAVRLSKTYRVGRRAVRALSDVSFTLGPGETLGLVGESGSGKTTLARLLLGLVAPDIGGEIRLDGVPLAALAANRGAAERKALRIVLQDPDSALNRAHTVRHLIGRVLRLAGLQGAARKRRLAELLAAVRLEPRHLAERPRQLSGGLKQRVAIARAFAGEPRVVICDEPTSALDLSVQAAILNLLADLQRDHGTSTIFISHDLSVVRFLADRIAVLYRGCLMEIGPAEQVFAGPHHPYTEALLSAAGMPGERRAPVRVASTLQGTREDGVTGCVFHARCPRRLGSLCKTVAPPVVEADGHAIRCHIPRGELGLAASPD
ncbi:MAG: ABC transporter ATP-binding protein [Rhodospirillales bacterium]|nr:ABC transporter ATP-binding protein [Rhodospirillales bacterium]